MGKKCLKQNFKSPDSLRISESGNSLKNTCIFGQIYQNLVGVFSPTFTNKLYNKIFVSNFFDFTQDQITTALHSISFVDDSAFPVISPSHLLIEHIRRLVIILCNLADVFHLKLNFKFGKTQPIIKFRGKESNKQKVFFLKVNAVDGLNVFSQWSRRRCVS